MPAVVRGGRRQAASAAPARRTAAAPRGRAAQRSSQVSPALIWTGASFVLCVALAASAYVFGPRVVSWTGQTVDNQMAAAGFRLEQVHVTGASPEGRRAILDAVMLREGQPTAFMDIAALRQDVEAVGWVSEARVIRLLPDTLVIDVTERRPAAVWQSASGVRVVDGQGVIIPGAAAAGFAELPLVMGEGAGEASAELIPLIEAWPRLRDRVEAAVRVDQRRWNLLLKDGGVIQLPADGLDAAMVQLEAMDQQEHLLDVGFARVDLRAPESVAIEPRGAV